MDSFVQCFRIHFGQDILRQIFILLHFNQTGVSPKHSIYVLLICYHCQISRTHCCPWYR